MRTIAVAIILVALYAVVMKELSNQNNRVENRVLASAGEPKASKIKKAAFKNNGLSIRSEPIRTSTRQETLPRYGEAQQLYFPLENRSAVIREGDSGKVVENSQQDFAEKWVDIAHDYRPGGGHAAGEMGSPSSGENKEVEADDRNHDRDHDDDRKGKDDRGYGDDRRGDINGWDRDGGGKTAGGER